MKLKLIIAVGDPFTGLELYGPFDDADEALTYAHEHFRNAHWIFAELLPMQHNEYCCCGAAKEVKGQ